MKILISGATGFIGSALVALLQKSEHQLYALVRQVDTRLPPNISQYTLATLAELDQPLDAFINLAGEGIADRPWSKKRKAKLYESRVTLTKQVKEQLKTPPKMVLSMSAIGYYGSFSDAEVDENSPAGEGFAHELCQAWEASALAFNEQGTRTVIYRLGVVLSEQGGALTKMRPSYLCGLGGKIGSGRQGFSWVHLDDVLKAIEAALDNPTFTGIYNLTSPHMVEQKDFAKVYAKVLKRPTFITVPKSILRLTLGEMSSLLTHGVKAYPKRLIEQKFSFDYANLAEALLQLETKT
ncbi:TIGR01777 family oxidoreductase [Marinomonas pollencensis]|uniref:TIGR01777 family protein n=1 Tax=Marinomonas pollencensis TaxID=491954 RepID=A0A3E0DU81_9GAMM|nr:TIGR01777 family oxidoreductase [Marinomonas pollencensis]REG85692.1 hypothetical protein DFP81_102225 [Marinomonas pollencensis]